MSPIIEMHVIQSLQPNNLNRDDTGAPKSTVFGGVPRRRVSSQSLKRAQRLYMRERNLVPAANLGVRTKRLVEDISRRLSDSGRSEDEVGAVARVAVQALELGVGENDKTEYLVFMSGEEVDRVADEAEKHFTELATIADAVKSKDDAKKKLPSQVLDAFGDIFGSGKAVDVALFGRMLADLPEKNIEAASQVAHAFSTHAVDEEWDYFTAVDDLKPEDTSGADMIGSIGFSACCLYRYQAVSTDRLVENLDGDRALAGRAVGALLEAIVRALPGGKQTTLASPNPPGTVMAVVRAYGGESLANAFVEPVRATDRSDGLEQLSLERLQEYWARLRRMYGQDGLLGVHVATLYPEQLGALAENEVASIDELIQRTAAHVE